MIYRRAILKNDKGITMRVVEIDYDSGDIQIKVQFDRPYYEEIDLHALLLHEIIKISEKSGFRVVSMYMASGSEAIEVCAVEKRL